MNQPKRERTFTWSDPQIGAQAALKMNGLEYLKAMERGELPRPPIVEALDLGKIKVEHGNVSFEFIPAEYHYNPIGSVHGGVISTILDSAMGCTLHSLITEGTVYTTLELKVNFLRAIKLGSGPLICSGKIIHFGSKTALLEAQIVDNEGKVYAHGVSTCLLMKLGKS
jgi:uncharacterized protein (TIGR00369 family)